MPELNYAQPPHQHMGVSLVVCHLRDMHCSACHLRDMHCIAMH